MRAHVRLGLGIVTVVLCSGTPAAGQALHIRFEDGLITVQARNASIQSILAEWARVGETRIINAGGLTGEVTVELERVPERQALSILLRGANGFIARARAGASPGVSQFETISIAPPSAAKASSAVRQENTRSAVSEDPSSAALPTDADPDVDEESERRAVRLQLFGGRDADPQSDDVVDDRQTGTAPSNPRTNQPVAAAGTKRPGVVTPAPEKSKDD
jgi:hypothetical protein